METAMSDHPPLLGCGASGTAIEAYDWERYGRELGREENAWLAAHAALLHDRPVRFERTTDEPFYVAPFKLDYYEQHPKTLVVDHIRLDEVAQRPSEEKLHAIYRGPQADELQRFYLHFRARDPSSSLDVHVQIAVDAPDLTAARRTVSENWGQYRHTLKDATTNTVAVLLHQWEPEPDEFLYLYSSTTF
jgi:hypothetical protein